MSHGAGSAIVVFDIDGVVRDVSGSYRRALADTVEEFTGGQYRPSQTDIDTLKAEGIWNNDWEASQELVYRYYRTAGAPHPAVDYHQLVAFFQSRYRGSGSDPSQWTGYICQEPLLMGKAYLDSLTAAGILWGFFSGATRGSATYVLESRLELQSPVLIAMEDAPGKPDPTGLFMAVQQLDPTGNGSVPIFYAGDTVADLYTVQKARPIAPDRRWVGIGILPPHVQETSAQSNAYRQLLQQAGADIVLDNIEALTPELIQELSCAIN